MLTVTVACRGNHRTALTLSIPVKRSSVGGRVDAQRRECPQRDNDEKRFGSCGPGTQIRGKAVRTGRVVLTRTYQIRDLQSDSREWESRHRSRRGPSEKNWKRFACLRIRQFLTRFRYSTQSEGCPHKAALVIRGWEIIGIIGGCTRNINFRMWMGMSMRTRVNRCCDIKSGYRIIRTP